MAKIQITESDIKKMVYEGVMRLKEMRTEIPDKSLSGSLNAVDYLSMEKDLGDQYEISALLQSAELPNLIPFDLYFPGGVTGAGPDDEWGDMEINNKEELDSILQKCLLAKQNNPASENVFEEYSMLVYEIMDADDLDEFEYKLGSYIENGKSTENPYEPDPDMMPGGHDYLEESINEHDPDDPDYGQVGDWYEMQAQQVSRSRTRSFKSAEEFEALSRRMGLEMQAVSAYVRPDRCDKFMNIIFFPASISFDAPDPSVGWAGNGWQVDDIAFEYGKGEKCVINGETQDLVPGKIKWLDDSVNRYINEHEEQIIDNIYGNN